MEKMTSARTTSFSIPESISCMVKSSTEDEKIVCKINPTENGIKNLVAQSNKIGSHD